MPAAGLKLAARTFALIAVALSGNSMAFADGRGHDRYDEHRREGHRNAPYPARGAVVSRLPRSAYPVRHHRDHYYFSSGVWYRPMGSRYMVVTPPIGAFVTVLPHGYVTLDFGGRPYYRYNDIYYGPHEHGYVVVAPPVEAEAGGGGGTQDIDGDDLFVYPKMNQSAQQQAGDRYECHEWASDQTGYDPTRESGGVPPAQAPSRRSGYQRAMSACLEARGYTVR